MTKTKKLTKSKLSKKRLSWRQMKAVKGGFGFSPKKQSVQYIMAASKKKYGY